MLDNEFHIDTESKATIVSIVCDGLKEHQTSEESETSLNELKELLRTLGIETTGSIIQNRKAIDSATVVGSGKILEIAEQARAAGSHLLVFDAELTGSQVRNIKELSGGLSVVDRCHIILEIFAKHAKTREAKIQIEVARLQYLLPRLAGFWTHLSRQKGGIGVGKGEGEKQIELDRRIVRSRIEALKDELESVIKSRDQQKKKRQNQVVCAALVGYTNAGKSSLMNRLCKVNVLEENKLFATLDSTFRTLNPDTKPPMLLIDTVGFLSNLPNSLIDGFRTTLESALEADLLIVVVDISDKNYKKHIEVTHDVLKDLGLEEKEKIIVFNKKDLLKSEMDSKVIRRGYKNSFVVSSLNPDDMDNLRTYLINYFLASQREIDIFIPYEDGHSHATVEAKTNILSRHNHETGIYYKVKVPENIFNTLNLHRFILAPEEEKLLKEKILNANKE